MKTKNRRPCRSSPGLLRRSPPRPEGRSAVQNIEAPRQSGKIGPGMISKFLSISNGGSAFQRQISDPDGSPDRRRCVASCLRWRQSPNVRATDGAGPDAFNHRRQPQEPVIDEPWRCERASGQRVKECLYMRVLCAPIAPTNADDDCFNIGTETSRSSRCWCRPRDVLERVLRSHAPSPICLRSPRSSPVQKEIDGDPSFVRLMTRP